MEEIYKTSLLLIHSLTQLNGICNQFKDASTDENGEKIIDIIDKCEEKFLKVKEEIVRMIKDVEDSRPQPVEQEISAIETAGGFLINDKDQL
jgi:hypothetical protein